MKAAEVIDAIYDSDREVVEYTMATEFGKEVTATVGKHFFGPHTELSDNAMQQLADELPGTPVHDERDGKMFRGEYINPEKFDFSIGFGED